MSLHNASLPLGFTQLGKGNSRFTRCRRHSQTEPACRSHCLSRLPPVMTSSRRPTIANQSKTRVHDLKHTFGQRLRSARVSFEDRHDLLGHRSRRITTHYSAAELSMLIEAADTVCDRNGKRPEILVMRGVTRTNSRKKHGLFQRDKRKALILLAGEPGLEPGLTESESAVLPIKLFPNSEGRDKSAGTAADGRQLKPGI